ncbi:NahK/ErcS family hybrid sensor histidine kinase/response regulator [Aliidiomarina sp.]|uniref:PAS domain-containing hybrid sensor histidine kinase/response regulator n=1 Tax=Aliidiomarina sp. TaxID=1872439 RepID=UPI003A4D61E4
MANYDTSALAQQVADQQAQIERLQRINAALIQRIEQGGSPQLNGVHSPFAAFQHAAVLAEQVREHTRALKHSADVSKQKALAEKMLLLQSTVDNLSQGVALVNKMGLLDVWNQKLLQLSGIVPRQLHYQRDIVALFKASQFPQPVLLFAENKGEQTLVDGRTIAYERHHLPDGGYLLALTDITAHALYAESLAESERWIRTITDNVPAMIAYLSAAGIYEFVNRGYADFYVPRQHTILHRHITDIHGDTGFARLQPYIYQVLQGDNVVFEITEKNLQGEPRHLLKSYVPNMDSEQRVLGFFVLNRDITERKRTSEALRQANVLLERRVQERTAALSQAKNEAEQANASKSQFLAAVSHDVLQPLNAARLFNGAMLDLPLAENVRQLAKKAARSLDDVADLLRTLVDLSKLDAGALAAQIESVPLQPLLQSLADEAEAMLARKNIRLRVQPTRLWVRTDSALLARILRNFISNAYRYTPVGGEVLLGCRRRANGVEVQVIDTGVGIAAEQLQQIFQEFHRLPEAEQHHSGGLGLGLAIVERLARLLKHDLQVNSQLHRGSVFAVQVPLTEVVMRAPVQSIENQSALDEGGVVGIIENDPNICQALESLLGGWGYRVHVALSRRQLHEQGNWLHVPLDMLLVDYHLGNDLGTEVAQQLLQERAEQGLPLPQVLLLTANHSQALQEQAQQLGYSILHKPARPLQLRMLMRSLRR